MRKHALEYAFDRLLRLVDRVLAQPVHTPANFTHVAKAKELSIGLQSANRFVIGQDLYEVTQRRDRPAVGARCRFSQIIIGPKSSFHHRAGLVDCLLDRRQSGQRQLSRRNMLFEFKSERSQCRAGDQHAVAFAIGQCPAGSQRPFQTVATMAKLIADELPQEHRLMVGEKLDAVLNEFAADTKPGPAPADRPAAFPAGGDGAFLFAKRLSCGGDQPIPLSTRSDPLPRCCCGGGGRFSGPFGGDCLRNLPCRPRALWQITRKSQRWAVDVVLIRFDSFRRNTNCRPSGTGNCLV